MPEKDMGRELTEHNEKIVNCLLLLKEQRDELAYIIEKQYEERKKLETEMERITYKLCLINKSLAQRLQAKDNYDRTIAEIEEKYQRLVDNSGELLLLVQKECDQLDSINNKKTSTDDVSNDKDDHDSDGKPDGGPYCPGKEKDCTCAGPEDDNDDESRCFEQLISQKMMDPEEPTKLEKNESDNFSMSDSLSLSEGRGQSVSNDDCNEYNETKSSLKVKKRVSSVVHDYSNEMSIRQSILSYQESLDKECACQPTKKGKAGNENKSRKPTHEKIIDIEIPTKLEKNDSDLSSSVRKGCSVSDTEDDIEEEVEEDDEDSFTQEKNRLSVKVQEYNVLRVQESLLSYEDSVYMNPKEFP